MIRVKVELEPFGMTINSKTLAEIRIWNTTTKGITEKHNYEYEVYEPDPMGHPAPIMSRGSIQKYNRNQPVIKLLEKVIEDLKSKY